MFISSYKLKSWLNWPPIGAHICTFAVAVSFGNTWRAPRDAFRYGGLMYMLILTVALVVVALPITMLQLAIGQLSQQDAVGVWRAVPFFKGVGYLRLMISILASMYASVYVGLIAAYFLYTISNSIPFYECQFVMIPDDNDSYTVNARTCFNETFLAPVGEKPEYYVALSLIVVVLSMLFPFVLFSPIKYMKRILYILGPMVIIIGIVIMSSVGDGNNLSSLYDRGDIRNMMKPDIWHGALIQSLVASHTSNGYLIIAGDTIYSNTNVQWTALAFLGANVVASWAGLVFWYGIGGSDGKDTSSVAVLIETYSVAVEKNLNTAWPLLTFIMLLLSGTVTMLTLLYPIYDHCRRVGGSKWRYFAIAASLASVAGALALLAGGLPALSVIEDVAVPMLISVTTVMEILAFVLVYGYKTLTEDVDFLMGHPMKKHWVVGWFAVPSILIAFATWWIANSLIDESKWMESPWEAIFLVATAGVSFIVFIVFAVVSVSKQVQYDTLSKLQSSFRPSRHWGPRDPITHYYWLARREESQRNLPRTSYRRQLGQFSDNASFVQNSNTTTQNVENKKRSNSDDWLYTVCRKNYLKEAYPEYTKESKKRSKSLDWSLYSKVNVVVPDLVLTVQETQNNVTVLNKNLSAVV